MIKIDEFRNAIAEQGGDTVLCEQTATLEVYCGERALEYKLANWYGGSYHDVDESQYRDLNA